MYCRLVAHPTKLWTNFWRFAVPSPTIPVFTWIDQVAASETPTGARNRALAHFTAVEGNLHGPVDDVLSVYFRQCSIAMSCRQLAMAGRFVAAGGVDIDTPGFSVSADRACRITALTVACGSYDASDEFAFRIGFPAKSGVGGGILGVVPGVASIAAWCPGLNEKGNSLLATRAFKELVWAAGRSVFGAVQSEDGSA